MNNQEKTRHLLSEHFEAHPKMGIDDLFKFLHQSVFGCEHAVSSRDMAVCRVADEAKGQKAGAKSTVEPLDGAYSRLHLGNISNEYIPFLPLFAAIDELLSNNKRVLTAIEGGSASGKSTLGELLESVYDCTVFHMDDFFLRPKQRTPERLAEPGGNVDRERFLQEVLIPLSRNEAVEYRRFDCSEQRIMPGVTVMPKKLTVVEGAYSMHPDLEMFYDYSVFLNIDEKTQKKRIEKRNSPQFAKRFFDEWIPMENNYFQKTETKNRCDLIIEISEQD